MSIVNPFKPFGDGVRIGACGSLEGNIEIAVNISDLCQLHHVDRPKALRLEYPNGSTAILRTSHHDMVTGVYLTESAYQVFMAWVGDCHG